MTDMTEASEMREMTGSEFREHLKKIAKANAHRIGKLLATLGADVEASVEYQGSSGESRVREIWVTTTEGEPVEVRGTVRVEDVGLCRAPETGVYGYQMKARDEGFGAACMSLLGQVHELGGFRCYEDGAGASGACT